MIAHSFPRPVVPCSFLSGSPPLADRSGGRLGQFRKESGTACDIYKRATLDVQLPGQAVMVLELWDETLTSEARFFFFFDDVLCFWWCPELPLCGAGRTTCLAQWLCFARWTVG